MGRFVEGEDRHQSTLLPACLDDYIAADNPVRVVDAFIEELDLCALGFERVQPAATGRPAYHPATLLKIYLYGYLNRIQSSRRLEREATRNVELMWLTGRLVPDFKTIADFRKANSAHGHRKYLNGDERQRFLTVAAALPRRELATLCMVLAHTGCRISEALALTHTAIASGDGVVAIRCLKKRGNQLVYGSFRCRPKSWRSSAPFTGSATGTRIASSGSSAAVAPGAS